MTLMALYDQAVARDAIRNDELQRQVVAELQQVADSLDNSRQKSFLRWFGRRKAVRGLYLYGPVGVGKTWLMDLLYDNVAEGRKARFHFHHFMQQIDEQLRLLQGKKDPIKSIALRIAQSTRLLCLDEFLVQDVAHAMMLAQLLQVLFAKGVVLVTTANTAPDNLYWNGVRRERFIPAILLLKEYCHVFFLNEARDYRLGHQSLPQAWLYPADEKAWQILALHFQSMTHSIQQDCDLEVQKRLIHCVQWGQRAVWFEFNVLCNLPRSPLDYLEIAERFDTLFLSNIPRLKPDNITQALLLIHLIDVLYDKGLQLIASADGLPAEIYPEGPMKGTFQRTLSRLEEMQSADYLARHQRREKTQLF